MDRLYRRNYLIKLLSLLLAFVLWVYVSNEQNPVREKIINVNLENTELAQSFLITGGMPESVRVRVQGNRIQLANLGTGDFRAVVDIPEGKTGEMVLPVRVIAPSGLRVAQVIPEEVHITVDRIVERQVPVAVSLRGTPAQGYTALAPVCQPGTVTVRGPAGVVNKVNQATAVVDIQSASADVEHNLAVSLGISDVSPVPSMVKVTVPIVSTAASKTVPILPQVTGSPADGYTVKRSFVEPASVQVFGPEEVLSGISHIITEPFNIQGADKNLSEEVALVVPQGIVSVQPDRVNVQVEVTGRGEPVQQPPEGGGEPVQQEP